jgi:hypothetical protein
LLDVRHRFSARGDGGQKIFQVRTNRRCAIEINVLLGSVLGIFIQFADDIFVNRRAVVRDEVVTGHAGFERALFTVENGAPRILRIGGRPFFSSQKAVDNSPRRC